MPDISSPAAHGSAETPELRYDLPELDESLVPVGLIDAVYAFGEPDRSDVEDGPEDEIDRISGAPLVAQAFDRLSIREQDVLDGRLELSDDRPPLTLEEVGRILGVTRERIRQIQEGAFKKLRASYEIRMAYDDQPQPMQPVADRVEPASRWSPEQLRLQRQWFEQRKLHADAADANQAAAAERWRRELIAKQEQGDLAFVRGDLQIRPHPAPIAEYLETSEFEGRRARFGHAAALQRAIEVADEQAAHQSD